MKTTKPDSLYAALVAAGVPEGAITGPLSFDGQGVIMAGQPGRKVVVARCEGGGLHLAQVFTAALDLLEACKMALSEFEKQFGKSAIGSNELREAIAKAQGESDPHDLSHKADCAQRMHTAAECTCGKADAEALADCRATFDASTARLKEQVRELRGALQGLFEHCVMIHKHWGEGSNTKEADAAIAKAKAINENSH